MGRGAVQAWDVRPSGQAWTRGICLVVFAALTILVLATFRDYGIGWDGRVQATYGHKLLSFYLSGFRDTSAFHYSDLRFYGGFFDLTAALLDRISPFGEFETRHLLGAAIFLGGVYGAWRLVRELAGARAAIFATLALASTPLLYGHAFMNPKDSPFAWLLVWVLYFGCRILREGRGIASYIGFAIFLGLALGTRVFAFAYLGYLVLALAWPTGGIPRGRRLRVLAAVLPVAVAVMIAFWPWAALAPGNISASVDTFLHFPHRVPVLWDGEIVPSTAPPRDYLLLLLAVQLPEYVIVGLGLAALFAVKALREKPQPDVVRVWGFIAAAAVVPVAVFAVLRPTVYNGLRQFLFIVPPLVILGAVGWERLLAAAKPVWLRAAVAGLFAACVVREGVLMRTLHPYEYVAFNDLVGRVAGAAGRFELDYWGLSLGEAAHTLDRLTADDPMPRRVFVCGDRLSAEYYLPRRFVITAKPDAADFIVAPNEPPCRNLTRRPMRVLGEVQRDGVVLSRVFDLRARPSEAVPSS